MTLTDTTHTQYTFLVTEVLIGEVYQATTDNMNVKNGTYNLIIKL